MGELLQKLRQRARWVVDPSCYDLLMTALTIGGLTAVPALSRPDLLAAPVAEALAAWPRADEVGVVEIDPAFAQVPPQALG